MTSPSKESINLFICDDIRKEEQEKLSLLGIYYNRIISVPKNEQGSEGVIPSLCFVITLNGKPESYPISFEILENIEEQTRSIFRSPDEILVIKEGSSYGIFAAKLGNVKYNCSDNCDYTLIVKIKNSEFSFPFKYKEL